MENTLSLIEKAQMGDEEAKERLVVENTGLIWSIVKRFTGRGHELEDLYQIGCIGLLKCIDKFDMTYEVRFSTYAVPMIMGEIKRFLRDDGMIKVSRSLKEMAMKAKYAAEDFKQKNDRQPTMGELAALLETTKEDLAMAMEAGSDVESLQSVIYQNDGSPIYLIDKLDEKSSSDGDLVDKIVLKDMIDTMDEKEKKLILLRYFEDKTQSEIAKIMDISQVQVSRIEKRIIRMLKEKLEV